MALAYALRLLEEDKTVKLTNYASFLAQFSPEYECEIVEDTSWSCSHGVERWRSNCGCNGGKPGFNQEWRAPAAPGSRRVARRHRPAHRAGGCKLFNDVWAARDAYIASSLTATRKQLPASFSSHATHMLSDEEQIRALELMEMQRHAQLMYTSCGWFFDDISGIETVQIIAYAARVLQLAQRQFAEQADSLEPNFLARLAEAHSNVRQRRRRRADLQEMRRNHEAPIWSRLQPTTPSALSFPHLPRRRISSASTSAASPTTSQPLAADASPWAARTSPAPSPATTRPSPLQFSTSATKILLPPSNLTAKQMPQALKICRAGRRRGAAG